MDTRAAVGPPSGTKPAATGQPHPTATRSTLTTCTGITVEADDADQVLWGIVHSHVKSPAVPSPTDIGLAFYPESLYLLVSLADDQADPATGDPSLRAWRITGGVVHEAALELV